MRKWLAAVGALCALAANARAAEVPWMNTTPIKVSVKNQSLPDLLRALAAENHVPVILSDAVKGSVTGNFLQRPAALFDALAMSYGLSWYYDGHLLHVYAQTEDQTRTLPVAADRFPQLKSLMRQLGLDDNRFPIHWLHAENALQVSGPPRYVEQMEELAQLVDGDTARANAPMEVRVFRLKNAWAMDIVNRAGEQETTIPGVASLLRQLVGGQASPQPVAAVRRPGTGSGSVPATPSLAGIATAGAAGRKGDILSALGATMGDAVAGMKPGAQANAQREFADVSVEADPRTNAVIVRGARDKIALCEKLVADLDTPSHLVEIEATIIDVDTDQAEQFGVSARLANRGNFDLGVGRPRVPSGSDAAANAAESPGIGGAMSTLGGVLGVPGAMIGSIVLGSDQRFFAATLSAFVRNGNARVVAKPRVLTLDNTEALLQNQQNFYIRVAGAYDTSVHSVTAGLVMRVTPQVAEENGVPRIRLLINIEDGTLSSEQVDQIPVVTRKSVNTQAVIAQGDSVLVGGYIVEESLRDGQKVPLLGDVPVVGALFRQKAERSRRAERMFLITPRLVARRGS